MKLFNEKFFLFSSVESIPGVGKKISNYLKKKGIEKINDLLWDLPYDLTDRSKSTTLNKLEIGKIFTINVKIIKYNFPRIRNLPNKILCKDDFGEIDLIFFNSHENYIRKILPLNELVVVSGKINFFRNKYQITNPTYVAKAEDENVIKKIVPKYALTEGLKEKTYRRIIQKVIEKIPNVDEWHEENLIKKMGFLSWKDSIKKLHNPNSEKDLGSKFLRRVAYDEIFANLLFLSNSRNKIKKIKKEVKRFQGIFSNQLTNNLKYKLTNGQIRIVNEINNDLKSNLRMFRILQGDVGSGKTIVGIIAALNCIESGYQCSLMAPTSILAEQHFKLLSDLIDQSKLKLKIRLLTGKTDTKERKNILLDLENKKIDFLIGTHALFQSKILFKKLGLIIIDEQHKFGVNQRIKFAQKGGVNCDVLLLSATPIPRTMMMSIYGDMDTSKLDEKPQHRQKILTLSKPENKIDDLWPLVEKKIENKEQVFWVCPLIEDSKKLDFTSTTKAFKLLNKKFPKKVDFIHGALNQKEKEKVIKKFLNKEISILVSTTVIEVGIDFPNATLIIIENSNKFGLAQLHQLRGRIGRGTKSGTCILLFKKQLSQNARKRIQILKSSDDGFFIAEEDMKLRGYGDIVGFKQSGMKLFKIADPVHHEELFKLAEEQINNLNAVELNNSKYDFLLKLFDKVDLIDEERVSS